MEQTRHNFTWFAKLTDVCDSLPVEYQSEMTMAIIHYGTHGTEPEFSNPLLNAVFAGVREDIDNSVLWREDRKSQKRNEKGQFASKNTETKTPVETVSEPCRTVTADTVTVTDGNRPTIPSKAIPSQDIPYHSKKGKNKQTRTKKFTPPSPAEVENYANEWILSNPNHEGVFSASDAEQFVNFYASNGWKVGRNQMKDWKASVRTWHLRNERDRKPKGVIDNDIAAQFAEYD
jgi:hypothetical protein